MTFERIALEEFSTHFAPYTGESSLLVMVVWMVD